MDQSRDTGKVPLIGGKQATDFIFYKGAVYEVPTQLIVTLVDQPDILEARIGRALDNGMILMDSTGMYGCGHCGHFQYRPNKQSECDYKGDPNIKWATPMEHEGRVFVLQMDPCVVHDATIAEIAERGLLKGYETQRPFDFPTMGEAGKLLELEAFEIKKEPTMAVVYRAAAGSRICAAVRKAAAHILDVGGQL